MAEFSKTESRSRQEVQTLKQQYQDATEAYVKGYNDALTQAESKGFKLADGTPNCVSMRSNPTPPLNYATMYSYGVGWDHAMEGINDSSGEEISVGRKCCGFPGCEKNLEQGEGEVSDEVRLQAVAFLRERLEEVKEEMEALVGEMERIEGLGVKKVEEKEILTMP